MIAAQEELEESEADGDEGLTSDEGALPLPCCCACLAAQAAEINPETCCLRVCDALRVRCTPAPAQPPAALHSVAPAQPNPWMFMALPPSLSPSLQS